MNKEISKLIPVTLILAALVALSAPAYPAVYTVITGDSVRLRTVPSTWAEVAGVLKKGTRVEVIAKTDLIDTIDGNTAPWYRVSDGRGLGYVFGKYVRPDAAANVPLLSLKTQDRELMTAFILKGHRAFGERKSEVKKKLGKPISEIKKKDTCEDAEEGDFFYTLVYDGVVFRGYESDGFEFIYSVTYTTDAYDFYGLKVGSSVADVERVLGVAGRYEDDAFHSSDTLYYGGEMYYYLDFKTNGERVTEITFTNGEITCGGW